MQRLLNLSSKGKGKGKGPEGTGSSAATVVQLNVGGTPFTTSLGTLWRAGEESRLAEMFASGGDMPKDDDGRFFIDRDGAQFGLILNFLRDGDAAFPAPDSADWVSLRREVDYYGLEEMMLRMDEVEEAALEGGESAEGGGGGESGRHKALSDAAVPPPSKDMSEQERAERAELESIAKLKADLDTRAQEIERRLIDGSLDGTMDERSKDMLTLELRKVQLEKDRADIRQKGKGRDLIYNLLIVGVTGTGKSSSLNTLLDQQACQVSGAQAQGTRGCVLRDASLDPDHFVSYIDTQGLGADTSISDTELLSQIMISTESILKMGIINNILISFDVNARTTPAMMANQLTLIELFSELRRSCFLVFTKWNTNAVQVEWNKPLRDWVRKWKRARTEEEITEDPPSYEAMYKAYCRYVIEALANEMDGGAFSKMGTFLAFFEARVLWMYNLDGIQLEDKEEDSLDPYISRLYHHYRNKALDTLDRGSTKIVTDDLTFLREDEATMRTVAAQLIRNRDEKIYQLEQVGREARKRREMKRIFDNMASDTTSRIRDHDFRTHSSYTNKIAALAGFVRTVATAGCVIS
ncbi:BTB/POZ domain-containing protein KCTD7 [Durusdinium trenchii]|uniref:BTB/POZ domain-containing protein KCTD7 n=1 Tax=Durusdinium trenchii TaxID=1381693 RepID=A0ABP0KDW1_9DINO